MYQNAGVDGNTTAQMLARVQSDVIAYGPAKVAIAGGTNDLGILTTAQIIANIDGIVKALRAAGIDVILCSLTPRISAKSQVEQVNRALDQYANANNLPLVDFYAAVTDPATGNYYATYNIGDDVHPSVTGAKVMAETFVTATANYFKPFRHMLPVINSGGANIFTGPLFLLDTNSDGVANGWASNGGAQTHTIITGDTNIVGNWQQLTATSSSVTGISQYASLGTWGAVGDKIGCAARITATVAAYSASVTLSFATEGGQFDAISGWHTDIANKIAYREFILPAASAGINANLAILGNGSTAQMAQVGCFNLSKIGF
jgi:hypothetical protein